MENVFRCVCVWGGGREEKNEWGGEGEREREGGRECMEIHSRKGGGSCESMTK